MVKKLGTGTHSGKWCSLRVCSYNLCVHLNADRHHPHHLLLLLLGRSGDVRSCRSGSYSSQTTVIDTRKAKLGGCKSCVKMLASVQYNHMCSTNTRLLLFSALQRVPGHTTDGVNILHPRGSVTGRGYKKSMLTCGYILRFVYMHRHLQSATY